MSKKKEKQAKTTHFDIQRKIVANMTTESWANVPHVTYNYEPDVTEFMIEYKRLNEDCDAENKITLNTVMLKIITEGLKADPIMNSHIDFNSKLVRGEIHTFEDINISMPMVLPTGQMMTINLHNFENKNLDEMTAYIKDVNRRIENTNLTEVMFDVSLDNTLTGLKQGKIKQTLYRLIGSKTGKHKVKTLSGKEKSAYYKIPEADRLTKHDIEQGTITVSNIGSVYRAQRGETCLLEIVPPQICAIAVGAVQDRPVVVENEKGEKEIAIRQIMPLCIAFDHRALDFGEIVPFIKRLDEIFAEPEIILTWRNSSNSISQEDITEMKIERQEREAKYNEGKERIKARKEAERAAEKAERDAKKAQREAEKAQKEAEEKAERAQKEAERKQKEAEKKQREANEKAEKALKEAEKKQKEAEEKAEKAQKEVERKQKEAEEKAKKDLEKVERLKKEAEDAQVKAELAKKTAEELKRTATE